MSGAFTITHLRSPERLVAKNERWKLLQAKQEAHTYLFNTGYVDKELKEIIARGSATVPDVHCRVRHGKLWEMVSFEFMAPGDVLKDSRGRGALQ